jgi:ABC-type polar amino acid transport system ATPase subunit
MELLCEGGSPIGQLRKEILTKPTPLRDAARAFMSSIVPPRDGATAAQPLLRVERLVKRFGKHAVLNNVSLELTRGQVAVIIGPSGTGKSTLLRCINGLEPIQDGRIVFDGREVHAHTRDIIEIRKHIGMIFQNFNLYPHLTALDNITLAPMIVLKEPRATIETRARELLEKVRLGHRMGAYPAQLSGGEQQRVAIARALAMNPSLLMFDEPTSALDPETVGDVLAVMEDLAREGRTMLVVTHELGFAKEAGDRMLFMDGGQIIEDAAPDVMLKNPQNARTRQFLGAILHV